MIGHHEINFWNDIVFGNMDIKLVLDQGPCGSTLLEIIHQKKKLPRIGICVFMMTYNA